MDTKVTSKTSSLKALLLKAWSERWTDLQWGINIKAILPRGVSGDVYNLADIIFQQALVGPAPNQLILSYLKHSLSSQLVSYAAVVQRISKFDGFHKPYCVICLLKLLENIENGITCRTKQEESMLPGSIWSVVVWLLNCHHYYLTHPCPQFPELTKKPVLLLHKIINNPFTRALLYLAKYEIKSENEIAKKCEEIEKFCDENGVEPEDKSLDVKKLLTRLAQLDLRISKSTRKKENYFDYSIQALLKVTALLNPTVDSQAVVNNLLIIQQLKGYNNARLYMEVIRASLINLNDSIQESCTAYWGAFTLIKLPQIIQLLAGHYTSNVNYLPEQAAKEIVDGFMLLMEFCPLLNHIDTRSENSIVDSLLNEIVSLNIVSETDQSKILEVRKSISIDTTVLAGLVPQKTTLSFPPMISNTSTALTKMNKSLSSDLQGQSVIPVLSSFLSGNSYELVLTIAAVKGELRPFVANLIKYNEMNRQVNQSDSVAQHVKSLIFDLTFVILCSLVQDYGSEVVLANKDGDSFFEKWVRNCLKEYDVNKTMTSLGEASDPAKIQTLIACFKSGEFDIRNAKMNWDEICFAMPAVMREIHEGWRTSGNSVYTSTEVKRMLDTISSQMCCLSICSMSWLCSYMQILQGDELLRALNMIQQFITAIDQNVRNAAAQNQTNQQDFKPNQLDYYKERGTLAGYILRKMQNYGNAPITLTDVVPASRSIPLRDAVYKQLVPVWEVVLQKGCLTSEAAHLFKTVISVSDPRLFMKFMLREIMKLRFKDELNKAVDLLFALFYFNIHDFTVALLNYIPHLLFKSDKIELVEPQSTAVAKLVAYVICAAVQVEFHSQKKVENAKDIDFEQDLEELYPATKIMRMSGVQSGNTPLVYVSTGCGAASQQQKITDAALLKSLMVLFKAFDNVAERTGVVNCDTYFVFNVIKQIVDCGKETAKPILSHLSNSLIPNLQRSVPELFTMELILQLYCLDTTTGMKTAVRDLCLLHNLSMKP